MVGKETLQINTSENSNPVVDYLERMQYLGETFSSLEQANRYFKKDINSGYIYPLILDSNSNEENSLEDNPRVQVITSEFFPFHDLLNIANRFSPEADSKKLKQVIRDYLKESGLPDDNPIRKIMDNSGSIGYFPLGYSLSGDLLLKKFHYFPKPLHEKLMQASSWNLISDETRMGLSNMSYYGIGLSVGAEILDVASRLGISNITLGDPDVMDWISSERHVWSSPEYVGWNKTAVAVFEVLKRNPYTKIRAWYDGLTGENSTKFFADIKEDSTPVVVEEADLFEAKKLSRKTPSDILSTGDRIAAPTIMIGDVGLTQIVSTFDNTGDMPFDGRLSEADPDNLPYGDSLIAEQGNMAALFASVGGVEYIHEDSTLLPLIQAGSIGKDISTVPQARGAVLLSGAEGYRMLIKIAEGKGNEIPRIRSLSLGN